MTLEIWISILILVALIFFWKVFPTAMYITTHFAQTPVSFGELLGMKMRKIDVDEVCNAFIMIRKSEIDVSLIELETAFLQKHDLKNIYTGLIYAKKNSIPMTLDQAKEADKKGIRIVDEIEKTLN